MLRKRSRLQKNLNDRQTQPAGLLYDDRRLRDANKKGRACDSNKRPDFKTGRKPAGSDAKRLRSR